MTLEKQQRWVRIGVRLCCFSLFATLVAEAFFRADFRGIPFLVFGIVAGSLFASLFVRKLMPVRPVQSEKEMEDRRQGYKDQQARHLEQALALPLPDAVFRIVHYNDHHRRTGPRPHGDPINLSILYDSYDPNQVEEWRIKAQRLRNDAYSVGDACLRKDGTYDLLRAEYEATHPGFMTKTYDDAVGFGMWQAR